MITPEQIHTLALQAGAARFYPEQQAVKQELYLVSQGFLEKFAELVEKHKAKRCINTVENVARAYEAPVWAYELITEISDC